MRNHWCKTILLGILAVTMILGNSEKTLACDNLECERSSEIVTLSSGMNNTSRHLTVSNGTAEMKINYITETKMDSIVVSVRLQKYSSGTWKRLKIWDDVKSSGRIITVTKNYKVTSGGKYRAKFVVTTKNGNSQKTETFFSNVVNY